MGDLSNISAKTATLSCVAASCDSVQVSGYDFTPLQDIKDNNIARASGSLSDYVVACNQLPSCLAFNSWGYLKRFIPARNLWVNPFGWNHPCLDLYTKTTAGKASRVSKPVNTFSKCNFMPFGSCIIRLVPDCRTRDFCRTARCTLGALAALGALGVLEALGALYELSRIPLLSRSAWSPL